jgi:hypothetical protein
MIYPSALADRTLHYIPGGDRIADRIGALRFYFNRITAPDHMKAIRANVEEEIKPISDIIESIVPDSMGRSWKTYIFTEADPFDDTTEICVTFGYFNVKEERAFHYFQRNGGMPVHPATGIKWTHIHSLSYDLFVKAANEKDSHIYHGGIPLDGTVKEYVSPDIDKFRDYLLNQKLLEIISLSEKLPDDIKPSVLVPEQA